MALRDHDVGRAEECGNLGRDRPKRGCVVRARLRPEGESILHQSAAETVDLWGGGEREGKRRGKGRRRGGGEGQRERERRGKGEGREREGRGERKRGKGGGEEGGGRGS